MEVKKTFPVISAADLFDVSLTLFPTVRYLNYQEYNVIMIVIKLNSFWAQRLLMSSFYTKPRRSLYIKRLLLCRMASQEAVIAIYSDFPIGSTAQRSAVNVSYFSFHSYNYQHS